MPSIADLILAALHSQPVPRVLSSVTFTGSMAESSIQLNSESNSISSTANVELIQYSLGKKEDTDTDFVIKIPFVYDRILLNFAESIELRSLKCTLTSPKTSSSFQVDSFEVKLPLNNNYTGLISLSLLYENEKILKFLFYREQLLAMSSLSEISRNESSLVSSHEEPPVAFQQPLAENPFPIPMADGPLFRETVHAYEQQAPHILNQLHQTTEKINTLEHSLKALDHAKCQIFDTLKEFKKEYLPSVSKNDLVYARFDSIESATTTTTSSSSSSTVDLTTSLLKALRHSTSETKIDFSALRSLQNFNSSKKNFEDESKKYYDWLSKLMGSGKSKDEKLLFKMKGFEVVKMEYFNFLYDTVTPMLLSIIQPNSFLSKDYWKNRTLRELAIKKVQNCSTLEEFSSLMQSFSKSKLQKRTLLLSDSNSSYKFDDNSPMKTGLLFVFGGQGKSGWHKQWMVLCNGKLFEYMNWRRGAELRNKPIDVSLCNIKLLESNDSKNNIDIGSRKNCFRVINAQGVEHVFQAFTPEDANEWIKALFEAGQMIAFNKRNSTGKDIQNGKSILSMQNNNKDSNLSTSNMGNISKNGDSSKSQLPRMRRVSSVSLSLLHVVQKNDPSNLYCADCGSTEQVEWVSQNLLVIFCIRCSSAHRALGTSVSKVRSLMLDSFVGENRALVHHICNSAVNKVYEAKLNSSIKPTAESGNEARLEFITNKYLKKAYVSDVINKNASGILLEGVKNDIVAKVLEGIAGGANINQKIYYSLKDSESLSSIALLNMNSSDCIEISLLEYALLHPSILDGHEVFDVAELLALNGCDAGTEIREGSLVDESAMKWWQNRINKINGMVSNPTSAKNHSSSVLSYTSASNSNYQRNNMSTKQPTLSISNRSSMSNGRPSLSIPSSGKKQTTAGSKSRIISPKDGFNLFKKKIKNLE